MPLCWDTNGIYRFSLRALCGWSPINCEQKFLVYPKPSETLVPFQQSQLDSDQNQLLSRAGNEEFSGLANYKAGDPIKRIDWKSMAKERGVFIKQFEEGISNSVYLTWENVPGPSIEERLSQLCRQVLNAENNAIDYGLTIPGILISPAHGPSHYKRVLKTLALFRS